MSEISHNTKKKISTLTHKNPPACQGGLCLTLHPPAQVRDSEKKKKKKLTYVKVSRAHCYWWHEMGKGPGAKKKKKVWLSGEEACNRNTRRRALKADGG